LVELFVIGAAVGSLIVNAVFQIEGGAGLGLTYVTGALVKVGQLAAEALRGGARWGRGPTCCYGRRWWRVPCAVRSPITGSISPRSGLPRPRR
jgi:hypothetical protein